MLLLCSVLWVEMLGFGDVECGLVVMVLILRSAVKQRFDATENDDDVCLILCVCVCRFPFKLLRQFHLANAGQKCYFQLGKRAKQIETISWLDENRMNERLCTNSECYKRLCD